MEETIIHYKLEGKELNNIQYIKMNAIIATMFNQIAAIICFFETMNDIGNIKTPNVAFTGKIFPPGLQENK
ncbi:MAG TPA: hypothetical protein VL053_15135 [Arachidicoccus sp.]|nr:hypothetical protein [Arachidicoccus sp.]